MWKKKPSSISSINNEITYLMAIDENGLSSLTDIKNNYFTTTGIVINLKDFSSIRDSVLEIKKKYWLEGLYNNKRVLFTSRDIRKKVGPFSPQKINYNNFIGDLTLLLEGIPIEIYSSTINKKKLIDKYLYPYDPYNINMEFIIERFSYKLNNNSEKGAILLESRNKHSDKLVHSKVVNLYKKGNQFHKSTTFKEIEGIYFNRKRTAKKKASYWQLELADLYSYPIHSYIRSGKKSEFYEILESKYNSYPNHSGKGLKIFPK